MACRWHRLCLLVVASLLAQAGAVAMKQHSHTRANPIRKVVNLLMAMQKKVEQEGKQTTELFDKFMCNVKTVTAGLEKSVADAEERVPQLESSIKETSAQHQQLAEDLKQAQEDREKAEKAMSTANSLREKESAEFQKESNNQNADVAAVTKAIKAIEKGQGGGAFLQSKASSVLLRLAMSSNIDLSNVDRDMLSNFLQGTAGGQEPSSGEILGIMKQMHEEMSKDLADMMKDEDSAVADHESLVVAKKKEIKASTKAIEVKTGRKGELAVALTKFKNDLEDTQESLAEDANFMAEAKQSAKAKEVEFEAYKKTQAHELVALADTIKMLNDDDALDTFKKTLPSASAASFIQMPVTPKQMRSDALKVLRGARHRVHKKGHADPRLDLLAMWVQGRRGGSFEEVLHKIDKLMANLKKEQADDESKKRWCIAEMDKTEDEVKWTARTVSDVEKAIASSKEDLKAILAEMKLLTSGIEELDASVKAATTQRKAEHSMYSNSLAENGAAKELLQMAKTRLNKFYNPEPEAPKAEAALVQEDEAPVYDADLVDRGGDDGDEAPSFVQVKAHSIAEDVQLLDDSSKSESDSEEEGSLASESDDSIISIKHKKQEAGGVLEMLSMLKEDISKQIVELEQEEKFSQKDYEIFMKDSSDKRAIDSKAVADKESAKAKVETELQKGKEKMEGTQSSLVESQKELYDLHNDCDWLVKNFDARKNAREDETDALTKARAVLSGADYS